MATIAPFNLEIGMLDYAFVLYFLPITVAIALHTVMSLRRSRWRKIIAVTSVMTAGWVLSLVVAALAAYDLNKYSYAFYSANKSAEEFSLIVTFGCLGDANKMIYPVIVTAVNAMSSVTCCFWLLFQDTTHKEDCNV